MTVVALRTNGESVHCISASYKRVTVCCRMYDSNRMHVSGTQGCVNEGLDKWFAPLVRSKFSSLKHEASVALAMCSNDIASLSKYTKHLYALSASNESCSRNESHGDLDCRSRVHALADIIFVAAASFSTSCDGATACDCGLAMVSFTGANADESDSSTYKESSSDASAEVFCDGVSNDNACLLSKRLLCGAASMTSACTYITQRALCMSTDSTSAVPYALQHLEKYAVFS